MSKWVQFKPGIVGQVVAKVKLGDKLVFGVDVNGEGAVFYVNASDTKPFDVTKEIKKA